MSFATLDALRRTVHTRSGDLGYLEVGSGPTALFVHGVGTNALLWRNVIDRLQGERRCIAVDLPLHGQSPAVADQDFSLPGLATVLADFCAALDLDRIDLVANDTGGAIAQVFAVQHPERLATLTLTNCDTHDNIPPPAFKPVVEMAAAGLLAPMGVRQAADPALARQSAFGVGYQDPSVLTDDLILSFVAPVMGTLERGRQFERLLCSLRADDLVAIEPELRTLTVPTLVVWGTDDAFFETKWAYWLRDTIPGVVEVVEVPAGRLFFPDEYPDSLVQPLRRFWSDTGARRPATEQMTVGH
jgi:pimeloyl-ACP methyl ester carboxylesterase